jgi:hypothetical protein
MTDHEPIQLSAALRERVRDEDPDLDQLIQVSTRTGARLRRRRTAGISIAGVAAGVTMIGIVGASLGGSGGTTGSEPGFATQPTAVSTSPDVLPTLTNMAPSVHDGPTISTGPAPVRVEAAGWECDKPADMKFGCARDGAIVSVTWRPAANHQDYLDPEKADVMPGVHTFVSAVHGRFFVTVMPGLGATQAQVDEVGAGLVWRR